MIESVPQCLQYMFSAIRSILSIQIKKRERSWKTCYPFLADFLREIPLSVGLHK
uniref:Uncharacterized protein n=1 Tax=Setaria italica TaxID=4555 RepID=K3XUF0_SETIT